MLTVLVLPHDQILAPFILYILIGICFSVLCILGANAEEQAFQNKAVALSKASVCTVHYENPRMEHIVKPGNGCGSVGVGKEVYQRWDLDICASWSNESCIRQPLHPGPWELRFVLSNGVWRGFGFVAAWNADTCDSPLFEVDIVEWFDILSCIQGRFPDSPNLALDIRAASTASWVLCEVNGALGIDYSWVLGIPDVAWLAARLQGGLAACARGLYRLPRALRKTLHRHRLAKEWKFEVLS